jgi:hypothetical protein
MLLVGVAEEEEPPCFAPLLFLSMPSYGTEDGSHRTGIKADQLQRECDQLIYPIRNAFQD